MPVTARFQFYEHSYRTNGKWRELTCSSPLSVDACCKRLGDAYWVGLYTIVDCSKYTGTDGKVYQFEMKVLGAKIGTLKTLRRKRIQHTSFAYTKASIFRDTDKSPACGNEFTFGDAVKDHAALFGVANFRGKKLTELYDKAEQDPEEYQRLARTFCLERGEDGKLVRRVPCFNFPVLYEPHSAEEIMRILAGDILPGGQFNDKKPGAAGAPGGGPSTDGVEF